MNVITKLIKWSLIFNLIIFSIYVIFNFSTKGVIIENSDLRIRNISDEKIIVYVGYGSYDSLTTKTIKEKLPWTYHLNSKDDCVVLNEFFMMPYVGKFKDQVKFYVLLKKFNHNYVLKSFTYNDIINQQFKIDISE